MSRMNSRLRKKLYPLLIARDGEECAKCGVPGNRVSLVIDHRDNNNSNNDPDNLQLLCRSCNGKKNPRSKAKKQSPMRKRKNKDLIPKESSAELAKSEKCKPEFRQWLFEKVKQHGTIEMDDAINGGAEKTDTSQQTIVRYIKTMISSEGNYEIIEKDEQKFVRFKPEYAAKIKGEEKQQTNDKVIPIQNKQTGS